MKGIQTGIPTIHSALDKLDKLANDPKRLDVDRSRFDREVSYVSNQSHNSTASLSPGSPSEVQRRERQQRRDREKWQLMKEHDASRANEQFDAQVYELEALIIEEIENRTREIPNGTNMNNLAHETVKNKWMKQGIWNEEWDHIAQPWWVWMHEDSPKATQAPYLNPPYNLKGEKLLTTRLGNKKVPRGDEPSRPFHQFIYQISEERERIEKDCVASSGTVPVSPSEDVNTKAYETVKSTWLRRGIWNNQWGILPGMAWKHESPLKIPDTDCELTPSPTESNEKLIFKPEDGSALSDAPPSGQADGPCSSKGNKKRKGVAAPVEKGSLLAGSLPAQADSPSAVGGRGASKRRRAAAPIDMKKPTRKFSKTVKRETSRFNPAVDDSNPRLNMHEGSRDTGRRRSTRVRNRAK
ncbi:uncharacterized protein N7500_008532 [Penicillium coprophilum]|uniref:uncharacterized protein n=1 Tax=Penicillium coprophilum TaxID=36646 RepID=UPI00238B118F|nr:uncharacterized protein N7500_008532 [Penicillium coprophilum]KAJ5158881.1 hypothetical protein N7500_008532 [Penicillium coprophilum]